MTAVDPATGQDRTQLVEFARRFPDHLIEGKDGQPYVAHHVINQRLLSVVGPFDFELVREIRGDVAAAAGNPDAKSRRGRNGTPALSGIIVGVVGRLTVEVDGRRTTVEEAGDVGDVHNWPHDGARLKDAASDALKRCAMRLGLALHLWAQEHYFLDQQLAAQFAAVPPPQETAASQEVKPGGTGERNGGPEKTQGEATENATTPAVQTENGSTPPGFDHLTSPGRARAWLRGQPETKELVERDAKASGIDLETATLDDLRRLISTAWRAPEVVA